MPSSLTRCPRCGARLKGLSTRCDACGADLVPYLARSGAHAAITDTLAAPSSSALTAGVPAPPLPTMTDVSHNRRAVVAPPPDAAPGAVASGPPFDDTALERPAVSEALEDAGWSPVLTIMIILIIGVAIGGNLAVRTDSILGIFVGGFTILIMGRALLPAVRAAIQRGQLLREGRPTSGVIRDRWTDKDEDGDPVYHVAYAFEAEGAGQTPATIMHARREKRRVVPPVRGGRRRADPLPGRQPRGCDG
ncbi:MAG: hypothetical protein N2378_04890 [Chloroflexaceae bacterium]|nr:hypothetical protein [Chloroflexaceae bacterium]